MPASPTGRRAKPSLATIPPDVFPADEPPAVARPLLVLAVLRPVLRVGDYEVGETDCPRLGGHPGIRY